MATAISGGSRIRTNTPAENAYNALKHRMIIIALRQLRLSTGKELTLLLMTLQVISHQKHYKHATHL
jgi:hypothetical protein